MSAEISSCVYLYLRTGLNLIIFTKFDNYFIVKHDRKNIITITSETLVSIPNLFKIYMLSLLVTENTRNVVKMQTRYFNYIRNTLNIKMNQ